MTKHAAIHRETQTHASAPAVQRHIGVIGLAVMGENLSLNIARNGYGIAVYNRTGARTREFLTHHFSNDQIAAAFSLADFVEALNRPRQIILMVKAGGPVDAVIQQLVPLLDQGDMIIDGGNSYFRDSERRARELTASGLHFVGMGISGGEEGALWGPSLMPGGPAEAYTTLELMLMAIAAKTEAGPCVTHVGPGGAGHYVKMVHNGIEYADMQLIAESYDVMRRALRMTAGEIADVFAGWNEGKLSSYLIEITAHVLRFVDQETNRPLVDLILDEAEQKGTGRWTSQSALELATPIPTIDAAVFARSVSAMKQKREQASSMLSAAASDQDAPADRSATIENLEDALYFAKISSYAQGMALLRSASDEYDWHLKLAEIARIWKGGCIIRAKLLDPIRHAFGDDPDLENLLLAPPIAADVVANAPACRAAVQMARAHGIPCPAHSASLDYVDSYRTAELPTNLTQAQRDYFGAHTYRRVDKLGVFHTEWIDDRVHSSQMGPEH
ncbi:MAG: NADP-dependent phosphogluconate dehydrogenase [Thermomicrobiales bacterium]